MQFITVLTCSTDCELTHSEINTDRVTTPTTGRTPAGVEFVPVGRSGPHHGNNEKLVQAHVFIELIFFFTFLYNMLLSVLSS